MEGEFVMLHTNVGKSVVTQHTLSLFIERMAICKYGWGKFVK